MKNTSENIAVQILVSGRVQGVGYRRFAQKAGQRLTIKGWVRNLIDGRVEIQASAFESIIQDFFKELKTGPTFSRVEYITLNPLKELEINVDQFAILPDGDFK